MKNKKKIADNLENENRLYEDLNGQILSKIKKENHIKYSVKGNIPAHILKSIREVIENE